MPDIIYKDGQPYILLTPENLCRVKKLFEELDNDWLEQGCAAYDYEIFQSLIDRFKIEGKI